MKNIEFFAWFGLAAIACIAWGCCLVLAVTLRRERSATRRLEAELRENDLRACSPRGVLAFEARGPIRVGRVAVVNEDGTVSVSLGDDEAG